MAHASIRRSGCPNRGRQVAVVVALLGTIALAGCSGGGGGGGGGGGPPPEIVLAPPSLTFESPFVGGTYTQTFAIQNSGAGVLKVTAVSVNGAAEATGFSVAAPAVPFTVDPAGAVTVTVTLQPASNATPTGVVSVSSNDRVTPVATVTLTATSTDESQLALCVLQGATVDDGCAVDGNGDPQIDFGTVGRGGTASRVVAFSNSGGGNVAVEIPTVGTDPSSSPEYAFEFVKMVGTTETATTLPFFLTPTDPSGQVPKSEGRVRITLTAPLVEGAVSGVSFDVTVAGTTTHVLVPMFAQVSGCPTGFTDCDGIAETGCEVATGTDLANCGGCGAVCGTANSSSQCVAGACQISCATDFGNCDGDVANGCEADLSADVLHCGGCATECSTANATPTCAGGSCELSCTTGFDDCDGDVATGCEVDLNGSVDHCGACANACPARANAVATCASGQCGFSCNAGYADCDGDPSNGCEININTDADHCGGCVNVCSGNHMATRTCAAGVCSGTCASGFGDCNTNKLADGCETTTVDNPAHCGACGAVCNSTNGTASCVGTTCAINCNAGWGNCDGSAANGCETNTNTSVTACGGCGQICSTYGINRSCTGGACTGTCNSGYADCNTNKLTDGCEIYTYNDAANCGACGVSCNTGANHVTSGYCSASQCQVSACTTGYYNQNGLFSDGCECAADAISNTCAAATSLGSIPTGASMISYGNITPVTDTDWFAIDFVGAGSYDCAFSPKVVLNDVSGVLRMSVSTDCSGTGVSCGEGGTSAGVTSWEFRNTGGATCLTASFPTTMYVRVYSVGSASSCLPYSISVTN